jgi:phospholipid-binding lipoprotein MlaA
VAVKKHLLLLSGLALAGCAHTPPDDPSDPLEKINRPIYKFNRVADTYVLRPVAKTDVNWTPAPIRTGVSNVLDNLFYPTTIVNDLLQAKFVQSGKDTGRFVVNTTLGIVGIFDVATGLGLEAHDEDLGQTLGYWGVGEGWYLMLPLLGPATNRDALGKIGDSFTGPTPIADLADAYTVTNYDASDTVDYTLTAVTAIDKRASLLDADKYLDQQLDPYIALRTTYLQNRLNKVYDGNPPKEKFDFDE